MNKEKHPDFNRHVFPPIRTAPGKRSGYYLRLRQVDQTLKTPKALVGDYINPNVEIDLPVGAIIVQRRPGGTAKFSTWHWSYAFVPTQAEPWQWSPECTNDRFITFRDNLTAALQFAPSDEANGYLPDPRLAAPPNFPGPPGPKTALAMARYAYALHQDQPPSPEQIAHLANTEPPYWLVDLAARSTPSSPSTALAATLAFCCNQQTSRPNMIHSERNATAWWAETNTALALTAGTNGSWRARRIDNTNQESDSIMRRIIDAMGPNADPPGAITLTLTELRDALATGAPAPC